MIVWSYVLFMLMLIIVFLLFLLNNWWDIDTLRKCLGGNVSLQQGEKLNQRNWNSPGKLHFLSGCLIMLKGTHYKSDHSHVLRLSILLINQFVLQHLRVLIGPHMFLSWATLQTWCNMPRKSMPVKAKQLGAQID